MAGRRKDDAIDIDGYSTSARKTLILGGDGVYRVSSSNPIPVESSSQPNEISQYSLQDVDEASATLLYLCKSNNDGKWLIQKVDTSSGVNIRFANESNNSSYTTYATAYTNRATLTYDLIEDLSGL